MLYSNSNIDIDIPKRDIAIKQYYFYLHEVDPEEYYRLIWEQLPELMTEGYEDAT